MTSDLLIAVGASGSLATVLTSAINAINNRKKAVQITDAMIESRMSKALIALSTQLDSANGRIDHNDERLNKAENAHAQCEENLRVIRNEFEEYIRTHSVIPGYTTLKRPTK